MSKIILPWTKIIVALCALVKRLWSGKSNPSSPSHSQQPNVQKPLQPESPLPSPSTVTPDDNDTDSPSPENNVRSENPEHSDGTSNEQPVDLLPDSDHSLDESMDTTVETQPDSGRAAQTPPGPVEVEPEKSNVSLPSPSERRQWSPPKHDPHPESDKPDEDAGLKTSTREPQQKERGPLAIPGRRRRQTQRPTSGPRRSPASRPELICRKGHGGTWEIVLSADEECLLASVKLGGTRLDTADRECRVLSLNGRLAVSCQDGKKHDIPLFDDARPLIFKLRKNWTGEGRKTSGITSGHFIVIAPRTWERTGRVPVEPGCCTDTDFLAHYFHRDANAPNEHVGGFLELDVLPTATAIELVGQHAFDNSEKGDLFAGAPPNLKLPQNIVWARVGQETENGWGGENFQPSEQTLSEVLDKREGHFFLRVYDSQGKLVDSTEFRYLHDLKKICVNGRQYTQDTVLLPGSSGYPPTEVRFVGADDSTISPVMSGEDTHEAAQSGALIVPPHPASDRISCALGPDGGNVTIVLDLPRIWWQLERDQGDPAEWRDTSLVMTRQEFQKHAHANATLWLLSKRHNSIHAGFGDTVAQLYKRTMTKDRIAIPLNDFVDHRQIDQKLSDDTYFNVKCAGHLLPLIQICADPMPEIVSFSAEPATIFAGQKAVLRWATRNADQADVVIDPDIGVVDPDGSRSVQPTKTRKYTLTLAASGSGNVTKVVTVSVYSSPVAGDQPTARVRCAGRGWRNGKGFSSRELQDASLTIREAAARLIPVDRRRRSSHPTNVEQIRRTLDV